MYYFVLLYPRCEGAAYSNWHPCALLMKLNLLQTGIPWVVSQDSLPNAEQEIMPIGQTLKQISWSDTLDQWVIRLSDFGIRVVLSIAVFYLGRLVIKLLMNWFDKLVKRKHWEKSVEGFIRSVVKVLLYTVLIMTVVHLLGLKAVSFAALLASAGVTIGMALSGQLQNFAGGALLLFIKPFKEGNYVSVKGIEGTVSQIGIFHTSMYTIDNKKIYVPNSMLTTEILTNFSGNEYRRCSWEIAVQTKQDYHKIRTLLLQLLQEDHRALKEPEQTVVLNSFSGTTITILVRTWVKNDDYWDLYWDYNQRVYDAFIEAGIAFPVNQLSLTKHPLRNTLQDDEADDDEDLPSIIE